MMDTDKTVAISDASLKIKLESGQKKASNVPSSCPFCNKKTLESTGLDGSYRCSACGYIFDPNTEIKPGTVLIGKYRILKTLGAGGCGDIYLCHPLNDLKTRYVLKVLRDITTPENQKRFEREAKLLKLLTYPVIVQFIDYWIAFSGSYIIMEYVEGSTLKEIISQYEIDEEATWMIAREVAKALQFAWNLSKVVHRDIKPSNIMINTDNEVRLLDFGMAKQTGGEGTTITANNTGLGTPRYMSPEQYKNAKNVDFKTDIYSLGVTMYFLLKKKNPFSGNTFFEIYKDTLKNSPPPKEDFLGVCSNECASLIPSMMELNPDNRPSSYDELINSIQSLLDNLA